MKDDDKKGKDSSGAGRIFRRKVRDKKTGEMKTLPTWWYQLGHDGQNFRKSTETTDKQGLGYSDMAQWQATHTFLRDSKLLKSDVDLSKAVTNEFIK